MAKSPAYPFDPRSTAYLAPGQFWAVPLPGGRFACGRVLQPFPHADRSDRRWFLAGLMRWAGDAPPTAAAIAGTAVLEQGLLDMRDVLAGGGLILGLRPLEADGLQPLVWRSGDGLRLLRGVTPVGRFDPARHPDLPAYTVWEVGDLARRAAVLLGGG